jgi:hypothetical protein
LRPPIAPPTHYTRGAPQGDKAKRRAEQASGARAEAKADRGGQPRFEPGQKAAPALTFREAIDCPGNEADYERDDQRDEEPHPTRVLEDERTVQRVAVNVEALRQARRLPGVLEDVPVRRNKAAEHRRVVASAEVDQACFGVAGAPQVAIAGASPNRQPETRVALDLNRGARSVGGEDDAAVSVAKVISGSSGTGGWDRLALDHRLGEINMPNRVVVVAFEKPGGVPHGRSRAALRHLLQDAPVAGVLGDT